ncbi:hypothetical protein LCGC14_1010880 [marine sediment metagenome]|uniref:Uncharacterized protein n=1 Tax=marine sediment metagenome TaxID=412755 RepID=A0A0F9N0F9_9ZZZZ
MVESLLRIEIIVCVICFHKAIRSVFYILLDAHGLLFTCRPGTKIADVLKMVDVPVCQADLLFDIIEGAVCLWVFPGVNEIDDVVGKLFDAL